jgi:hypothetical protein
VQLLDAEPKKTTPASAFRWFSATEQPADAGEIDSHHSLLALIHRTYSRRLTGKLQLVFGRVEKALFFDGGQVVFATSSDRQDGLGEVMLRAGALTQSQFEEASTLVETGQRFGSAIAEMGVYGVEEIISWVRRQVIQVAASVLDYPAGRYVFFSSLEKNVVPESGSPVPLGELLLEAVRKAKDLPLDRLAEDGELRVEPATEPLHFFKAADLEDGERQLLGQISQRISAKDIVSQSGLPKPQAARALYSLLLLGFVVGVTDTEKLETVETEGEPLVPVPAAAAEGSKVVEAPRAANIPEERAEDFSVHPQEAKENKRPSAENVTQAQPQLEEIPNDMEEPTETEAPPVTPVPLLKANMSAREVLLRATGIAPEKGVLGRELFDEETTSVLVAETGGVIRLSAAVSPGQLLVLANLDTKAEVIVQVVRKRAYKPTNCYLEVEFAEAAPRFWGTEFSAATALLPKKVQDVEAAAMVITAEATTDQPWVLPTAPDADEVQRFKQEVEELRRKPSLPETTAENAQAMALAQLSAEVSQAAPVHGPGDSLSTEEILNSGLDAAGAAPPPVELDQVLARWKSSAQAETPQPVDEFIKTLPKWKRSRSMRGSFTPEFRRGVLRLAILVGALLVAMAGAAWFKHWLPWKALDAKSKKVAEGYNTRVASDAPVTSVRMAEESAPVTNAVAPAKADRIEAPQKAAAPSGPVAQPAVKKITAGATVAAKAAIRPAVKPAAIPVAPGKEIVDVPPKLIHAGQAVASLEALRDFERGNVVIEAVVGTSGEVNFIRVISGPPSLRDVAVESLKQYKYEPATRNGQPVPAHVSITIHFRFEP